jgi:hypothetical protein
MRSLADFIVKFTILIMVLFWIEGILVDWLISLFFLFMLVSWDGYIPMNLHRLFIWSQNVWEVWVKCSSQIHSN